MKPGVKPSTQDRLTAKLQGGRQIAEILPTHDSRWVRVVFDDASTYRTTMDEAMRAMTEDEQRQGREAA